MTKYPTVTLTCSETEQKQQVRAILSSGERYVWVYIIETVPFLKYWTREKKTKLEFSIMTVEEVNKFYPNEMIDWYQKSLDRHFRWMNIDKKIKSDYQAAWDKFYSDQDLNEVHP